MSNSEPTLFFRFVPSLVALLVVVLSPTTGVSAPPAQEPAKRLHADQLFDPAHLVKVSVTMSPENWTSLCRQNRNFATGLADPANNKPFTYFPADVTIDGHTIKNVGVRKKGFLGSLDGVRPSLKIKFAEYADQDPVEGLDRLTLNNNKQDPSQLCQYLSYKLFRESGSPASRCNFALVTVNGTYLGIYSHVESIKPPMLNDRFGNGRGKLWEGTIADFFPNSVDRFETKNKRTDLDAIRQLANLLDQETISVAQVEELVDVNAFVKFWAMESLIGFWDGYTNNQNNYFLYENPDNKRLYYLPWGTDSCFTNTMPIPPFRIPVKSVHCEAVLANRLYRIESIQKLYRQTMNQFLDKHWQEDKLNQEIDRMVEMLKPHLHENLTGFDERVTEIRQFIANRRRVVEAELSSGAAELPHGARENPSFEFLGSAKGKFSTTWTEKTPRRPEDQGEATLTIKLKGQPIEFQKMGVTSEPSQDRNQREADGRQPPTVVFHGRRATDNKQWMLALGTTTDSFVPSETPAPVFGIVIEGNPMFFFAKMMLAGGKMDQFVLASGTIQFDAAARKAGAPVTGTVDVQMGKFVGGDHLPPR